MCTKFPKNLAASLAILILLCMPALAETVQRGSRTAQPAIKEQIDDNQRVPLRGSVRADMTPDRDLGPVEDELPLHLYMVLQRSVAQQADLENLIERQQQATAPEYHQWITPQQFGERFGVSEQDIAKISAWLESRGMHVRSVMNNASFIDFSATARDVRESFGTQLHYFNVDGVRHPALVRDPMIPAAMAPVVAGIQGLNKIPAHTNHTKIKQATYDSATHKWQTVEPADSKEPKPFYSDGSGNYYVTPQDFYTIYNVNPVFTTTKGASANVAVIEESDIEYGTVNGTTGVATGGDVATFRGLFGVNTLAALNMHVYHGYGTVACNAPGIDPNGNGEDGEASLDAEWASALAPAANLIYMSCDQSPDNGIFSSEAALIDNNLSDTMSLSYGNSELNFVTADYTSQDTLYSQAATQGQSFLVSAGDSGSDVADQNTTGSATSGINVSAFSSSPLVTVAGGTDFSDQYDSLKGGAAQSTYWGATNSSTFGDALGYVPETAWNDSCASSILANYEGAYTGAGYCATGNYVNGSVVGGSGGFSTHYSVPSYQSGITGYSGTMRAQPDISAFASNGWWGHSLISCDSHIAGNSCAATGTTLTSFGAAGGTSFVAPQMAGIFGLLVSYTGTRQGLLNPALYALAKSQFTTSESSCYSTGTAANDGVTVSLPASTCVFNDVTSSNNDVPCAAGATGCYVDASQAFGMLSKTGATSLTVAFPSTPGYDEVTGIGTLNVNNLFTNWYKAFTSSTKVGASLITLTTAQSTTLTATVTGGTPTGFTGKVPALGGTASFKAGTTSLGNCTLSSGSCTLSLSGTSLALGANSITATFAGSKTYPASTSSALTVTVTSSGNSPAVSLSATSLNFGFEGLNLQTAAQTVTLKNTGTGTLDITSIALAGTDPTSFVITAKTCGSTLAAGGSCTFSVAFKPAASGALSASVAVTDNASGSPQEVSISGNGVTTALALSQSTLTFGSLTIGSHTPGQLVTVYNTSASPITGLSITFGGTDPTYFGQLDTCPATLAVGANCQALVSFYAHGGGAISGSMIVASSVPTESTALSGTGIATPALTLSPSSLAFPTTLHGTHSTSQIVTVTNTGTTTATFKLIQLGGGYSTQFYQNSSCGTSLAPGAQCSIFVQFSPTQAGGFSASLELFDNAQGLYQSVPITGTGN